MPTGTCAVYRNPVESSAGKANARDMKPGEWDKLITKCIQSGPDRKSCPETLPKSVFRRAVFIGSDYYYHRFDSSGKKLEDMEDYDVIISRIIALAPRRVLEIGTGSSRFAVNLAKWRPPGSLTIGVDIDFESLKILEGRLRRAMVLDRFVPVAADARCLPFPSRHFDAVVSYNGLSEVEGIDAALNEIQRVMRPGGKLLCVAPLNGTNLSIPENSSDLMLRMLREKLHIHHGASDLAHRLKIKGFIIESVAEKKSESKPLRTLFATLSN